MEFENIWFNFSVKKARFHDIMRASLSENAQNMQSLFIDMLQNMNICMHIFFLSFTSALGSCPCNFFCLTFDEDSHERPQHALFSPYKYIGIRISGHSFFRYVNVHYFA